MCGFAWVGHGTTDYDKGLVATECQNIDRMTTLYVGTKVLSIVNCRGGVRRSAELSSVDAHG